MSGEGQATTIESMRDMERHTHEFVNLLSLEADLPTSAYIRDERSIDFDRSSRLLCQ